MPSIDEESLRNFLLAWPDEATNYLCNKYFRQLVHNARSRVYDQQAAEDIVQESFADFWFQSESIATQTRIPIVNYLFGIVKNKSLYYYNNNKARLEKNDTDYFNNLHDPSQQSAEEAIIASEKMLTIWTILSEFPSSQRQVLVMKFYRRMTIADIALEMNITIKGVQQTVTRAYKRLKKYKSHFI